VECLEVFPDSLVISDAAAAVEYIKTTPAGDALSSTELCLVEHEIRERIAKSGVGAWEVTTEVGCVRCIA
jgi:hypothetical protein